MGTETEKDAEKGDPETTATDASKPDSSKPAEPEKTTWRQTTCGRLCVGFWSAIAFILLLPIFLVLGIVACVVWLVLAPFKCCCPCCAPCLMAITEALFALAKIPKKIMTWLCTGPKDEEDEKKEVAEEKKDYGTNEEKEGEEKTEETKQ